MGFLDRFRAAPATVATAAAPSPAIYALGGEFDSLRDPRLAVFLSEGGASMSGISVSPERALKNPSVFRCASLICYAIGMLPLHLIDKETKEKATDHPLFRILHREPNNWQTAFDFRSLMQLRVMLKGNAYALIIRSRDKVLRLVPLDPDRVTPVQGADWNVTYKYRPVSGAERVLQPEDVLHLRGLSLDGLNGLSLVKQAADAIALAIVADLALGRMFKHGSFVEGVLRTDKKLSPEVIDRLKDTWTERYEGAGNAGKTPVLEESLDYKLVGASAKDAQTNETRAKQVEEIARIFGVPRPLLFVDETSWGSGIDVLGQFFVRYGLNPWFEAWQQSIERSVLLDKEKDRYEAKFNAGALLRGSMSDQGEFFARALGSGGHKQWMTQNEVRDVMDMPEHADGDGLKPPASAAGAEDDNTEVKDA